MGGLPRNSTAIAFSVTPWGQPALNFAVTGPVGEIRGYTLTVDQIPEQTVVDRAAAHFQTFYEGLPADERDVITIMLNQVAEMQQQLWSD